MVDKQKLISHCPGGRKSKIRALECLGKDLLLSHHCLLCPHAAEGREGSQLFQVTLVRALSHRGGPTRMTSSDPKHLPKPHLLTPPRLALGFNIGIWSRHKHQCMTAQKTHKLKRQKSHNKSRDNKILSELSEVIWRQQFPPQIRRIESGSDLSQTEDGCPGWALRGSSWSHLSPRAFWNFFSPSLPDPSLAPCLSPLHSPSSAQTLHGSPVLVSGLADTHPAGNLQAGEGGTFLNTLGRVFPPSAALQDSHLPPLGSMACFLNVSQQEPEQHHPSHCLSRGVPQGRHKSGNPDSPLPRGT